jgi:hypothetical protein
VPGEIVDRKKNVISQMSVDLVARDLARLS